MLSALEWCSIPRHTHLIPRHAWEQGSIYTIFFPHIGPPHQLPITGQYVSWGEFQVHLSWGQDQWRHSLFWWVWSYLWIKGDGGTSGQPPADRNWKVKSNTAVCRGCSLPKCSTYKDCDLAMGYYMCTGIMWLLGVLYAVMGVVYHVAGYIEFTMR